MGFPTQIPIADTLVMRGTRVSPRHGEPTDADVYADAFSSTGFAL